MAQPEARSGPTRLAPAASEGFKDAAAYDAHRPSYPPEAVDALLEKMGLFSTSSSSCDESGATTNDDNGNNNKKEQGRGRGVVRIVEIAAGTGKFTEALVAAVERRRWEEENRRRGGQGGGDLGQADDLGLEGRGGDLGSGGRRWEILATEPHPEMLRELEGKRLPGVVARRGGAEELGRVVFGEGDEGDGGGEGGGEEEKGGWVDGVIAAQAFHWFATEQVLDEIRRVLKPGGVFGMIWNIDDYNKPKSWKASTQWAQHLNDWVLGLAARDDNKRFRDLAWQDVFLSSTGTPLKGEGEVAWAPHWLREEALWRRIQTLSHVAVLRGVEKERAEGVFREAMAMAKEEKGGGVRRRRSEEGEVECHGRTYFAWAELGGRRQGRKAGDG